MQKLYHGIDEVLRQISSQRIKKLMIVCGYSVKKNGMEKLIYDITNETEVMIFSGYTENPTVEQAEEGIRQFKAECCDGLMAIGGGSAIDTAKYIRLCANDVYDRNIPFIVIPTTAGSGSEATKHIVVYKDGLKQSISDEKAIPDIVYLEPNVLLSLPDYQKKCTMLDALCQAIESWWSRSSNKESIAFSKESVQGIMSFWKPYIFENDKEAASEIMKASYLAGKAINITKTTAPHAMSYRLTTMYKLPHGHAVSLCMNEVWKYMKEKGSIRERMSEIEKLISYKDFSIILNDLKISKPETENKYEDVSKLTDSVNIERLKNFPVELLRNDIENMYLNILSQ